MMSTTDPWPIDRTHTAPSIAPPTPQAIAAGLVRTGITSAELLKLAAYRVDEGK